MGLGVWFFVAGTPSFYHPCMDVEGWNRQRSPSLLSADILGPTTS